MGLFSKSSAPREPIDITQVLLITVIAIVLVSIISGIIGIWVDEFAQVSKQVGLGVLLMVVMAAVLIPFMLIRRQLKSGAGVTAKDFIFVMLVVGLVIFLMIAVPNIFNLPAPFSVAQLQLQSVIMP